MTPKLLLKTPKGWYEAAQWDGENASGITPTGEHILVLPDVSSDMTPGGVAITEDQQSRNTEAAETGILVAVGEDAWLWNADRTRKYEGRKPQIGERVIFERYAGALHYSADGRQYRMMDDKCVGGLFELAKAATAPAPTFKTAAPKPTGLVGVKRPPLVAAR